MLVQYHSFWNLSVSEFCDLDQTFPEPSVYPDQIKHIYSLPEALKRQSTETFHLGIKC